MLHVLLEMATYVSDREKTGLDSKFSTIILTQKVSYLITVDAQKKRPESEASLQ